MLQAIFFVNKDQEPIVTTRTRYAYVGNGFSINRLVGSILYVKKPAAGKWKISYREAIEL